MSSPSPEPESARDKGALILGATSPLGAAMMRHLVRAGYGHIVLADLDTRLGVAEQLRTIFQVPADRAAIAAIDSGRPLAGLRKKVLDPLGDLSVTVFHLAHSRDRTVSANAIRTQNLQMYERAIELAREIDRMEMLVIATDVGLSGDYPGRFSENWIDVGQVPFDEVDRSSLDIERSASKESGVPILRARVGLSSNPSGLARPERFWRTTPDLVLPAAGIVKRLPRFLNIPVAVAKGSLAPLTPVDWAAHAMTHISGMAQAAGKAVHLVLDSPPTMDELLRAVSESTGGARLRGGLPADFLAKLGFVPGFGETTRRQADQIASWWTPHRYCLSRNDLDTSRLHELLQGSFAMPSWKEARPLFLETAP